MAIGVKRETRGQFMGASPMRDPSETMKREGHSFHALISRKIALVSPRFAFRFTDDFCTHVYEVRLRKDRRGVDVISETLPFGRLLYGEPNAISNAVDYAKHRSRSHDAPVSI
jgi:hypothetical protein